MSFGHVLVESIFLGGLELPSYPFQKRVQGCAGTVARYSLCFYHPQLMTVRRVSHYFMKGQLDASRPAVCIPHYPSSVLPANIRYSQALQHLACDLAIPSDSAVL